MKRLFIQKVNESVVIDLLMKFNISFQIIVEYDKEGNVVDPINPLYVTYDIVISSPENRSSFEEEYNSLFDNKPWIYTKLSTE